MAKRLHTQKNDIIILLFIQQKYKNKEIAFLMYRNTSKHIFFGSLCQLHSQGCHKGKVHWCFDLVSQATPFTVLCETRIRYRQTPQDMPGKRCGFCHKNFLLTLWLLRGISTTDIMYKGEIGQRVAPQKLATLLLYTYTYADRSYIHK